MRVPAEEKRKCRFSRNVSVVFLCRFSTRTMTKFRIFLASPLKLFAFNLTAFFAAVNCKKRKKFFWHTIRDGFFLLECHVHPVADELQKNSDDARRPSCDYNEQMRTDRLMMRLSCTLIIGETVALLTEIAHRRRQMWAEQAAPWSKQNIKRLLELAGAVQIK